MNPCVLIHARASMQRITGAMSLWTWLPQPCARVQGSKNYPWTLADVHEQLKRHHAGGGVWCVVWWWGREEGRRRGRREREGDV